MAGGGASERQGGSAATTRWIAAARAGDGKAKDWLCRELEPKLRSYVERNMGATLRRWVEPADIVQVVLFEVVKGLARSRIETPRELRAHAYRTALSRIRDAARRHRRAIGESILPEEGAPPFAELPSDGEATRADTQRWLVELVARLPDKYAQPVRLVGLEGLSYDEAADRLNLTSESVRKRYGRAREALRRRLEERGDGA